MSDSIWHDKNEKPVKVLYKNYIIITKWGSVYAESDVDSGCFIETDWAYLEDILTQADKAKRLQKAVDYALQVLDNVSEIGGIDLEIAKINQLIKGE